MGTRYVNLLILNNFFQLTLLRLWDMLRLFPIRLLRLLTYLIKGWSTSAYYKVFPYQPQYIVVFYVADLFFLLLDCVGFFEWYEIFSDIFKYKTRALSKAERTLAKIVYKDSIQLDRVRIDEKAYLGPPQMRICYVSFYTINSWGKMRDDTLIHELMHIWQYQKMGAIYIPRALSAQWTKMNYNYGGVPALLTALQEDKGLLSFNLEQQADIVADYFRIKTGLCPRWGDGDLSDLGVYENLMIELESVHYLI